MSSTVRLCIYEAVAALEDEHPEALESMYIFKNDEFPEGKLYTWDEMLKNSVCRRGGVCEPGSTRCKMLKNWAESARTVFFSDEMGSIMMCTIEADGAEKITPVYEVAEGDAVFDPDLLTVSGKEDLADLVIDSGDEEEAIRRIKAWIRNRRTK